MKRLIVGAALVGLTSLVMADTSMRAVEFEIVQGHFGKAEGMMKELIRLQPANARAHYVYAELVARAGDLRTAAVEAETARRLDPGINFTEPGNFRSFEAMLNGGEERARGVKPDTAPVLTSGGGPLRSSARSR